ncbi:MBL fold metallo-hydrolase [Streptosporangium sp. 'caverna']|uniref:MBL fold metallo-hydrolase n=1 Tax=Streptosporangium sp. 'caverna' TaxID=2202249 RepID=UPI000D7D4BB9|nr:MBL fold metallo-hydrolase [Streptosporangium sp. 'caverna']AWS42787.1 MBL fold metallo-hydrolase [Streptosporangium sp. 'caverna']
MSEVRFTHIGGPTVLIEFEGWRLLTDPTFDAPGRTYAFGWGTSSRKLTGPALPPDALPPLDAVLLTHDHHSDNLDDAGRTLLVGAGVTITTRSGARRLGGATRGLKAGQSTRLEAPGRPPIEITATPCRHGPPLSRPIVGDVIGFALTWPDQDHGALWITGDTVLHPALHKTAADLDPGTILLHLGGVQFPLTGPLRYTMTAADALDLGGAIDPVTVLPVHYEGWQHFQEGQEAITDAWADAPAAFTRAVTWLTPGTPHPITV